MNEASIAVVVSGIVTIATMAVGFLTLWVKLKYGVELGQAAATKAEEAVSSMTNKVDIVRDKIDDSHNITKLVNSKTDTIVQQTNGHLTETRTLVSAVSDRVSKLEDYNRESSHRLFDAVNSLSLKVERLLVVQDLKVTAPPPPKA